ncbi:hypothetical protein [Streptomyces boncukensis]|uniref:Uncharacterized protein n=1 Tax=Streptomyces boncukensis TaxID=2711219 RepID=A0A6G4WQ94_9ACTN|nr:hypothetical protein [Streptomyces boncukensis]NGO66797.1 hypothetical protein [Streptomyces boncukensis]
MSLHAGHLQSGWCPACKAYTYVSCALLLLTEQGVATIGELGWCEICDDPDDPLPPRRIDRAGS